MLPYTCETTRREFGDLASPVGDGDVIALADGDESALADGDRLYGVGPPHPAASTTKTSQTGRNRIFASPWQVDATPLMLCRRPGRFAATGRASARRR